MSTTTIRSTIDQQEESSSFRLKPIVTSKVDPKIFQESEAEFLSHEYNDWRKDLIEKGYAVVKGAISQEKAKIYEQRTRDWFSTFENNLDFENPETWTQDNIPVHLYLNAYPYYAAPHESFMWDARQEAGVMDPFEKIWGTDELLVSFDSFNITFPNRKDVPRLAGWPHFDQSYVKEGLQCVQGLLNIAPSGPNDGGLVVYENSHKLFRKFFDEKTDRSKMTTEDRYELEEDDKKWFLEQNNCEEIKVCAEPGDLILWDSRTVHWGMEPLENSNQIRTVYYISYTPRKFATDDTLALKKQCFDTWVGTTHWAHDNIVPNNELPKLPSGEVDPQNRTEPFNKPVLTNKLLQLAGVKTYN